MVEKERETADERESKIEMEGGSWALWNERVREIGVAKK